MIEEIRRPYERARTNRPVANQPQQAPVVARSANFDDFNDDDLLCDVDVDQIASNAVTAPVNGSTENVRRRIDSDILFDDDLDDDDFLQIGSQLDVQHSEQPSNVHVDHDDGSFGNGALVAEPQQNVAVTDDAYRFKIRGINLATVKQLNACPLQDKVRRKHLLIKGEIDSIYGNKFVREYRYSYPNVFDSLDCCIFP